MWALVIPLAFVAMALAGYFGAAMKHGRAKRLRDSRFYEILSFSAALVFGILLIVESHDGLIQLCDNFLSPGDSAVWSLVMAPLIALAASVIFGFALDFVAETVQAWHYYRIKRACWEAKRAFRREYYR